ncbi:MAG: hypothetical protein SGARI_008200, partial [Bacillariaceae sp.]
SRNQDGGEATGEESMLTAASRSHNSSAVSLSTAGVDAPEAGQATACDDMVSSTASSIVASATSSNASTSQQEEEEEWQAQQEASRRPSQQIHLPLPERCQPPFFQSPTQWTEFHLLYSNMDDFTKAHVQ